MNHLPHGVQRTLKTATKCIEWCSLGQATDSFHYRYKHTADGSWEISIYPALHEVLMGKDDGAEVFPQYFCSLHLLTEMFDTVLDIGIDTKENNTYIDGMLGNLLIKLKFLHQPHKKAIVTKKINSYTKKVMNR